MATEPEAQSNIFYKSLVNGGVSHNVDEVKQAKAPSVWLKQKSHHASPLANESFTHYQLRKDMETNGYISTAEQASLQALQEYQKFLKGGETRLTKSAVLSRLATVRNTVITLSEISAILGKYYSISNDES